MNPSELIGYLVTSFTCFGLGAGAVTTWRAGR